MRDDDEPRLPTWHFLFLGVIALMILVTNAVASRSILLNNVPDVAHLADLPPKALEIAKQRTDYYGVFMPTSRLRPALAAGVLSADDWDTPRLGYSVRQITFLGLPMAAYKEAGEVLYRRKADGFHIYGVDVDGVAGLEKVSGETIAVGIFPFWLYYWGWLAVIFTALFAWFEWRRQVRRREILGLL